MKREIPQQVLTNIDWVIGDLSELAPDVPGRGLKLLCRTTVQRLKAIKQKFHEVRSGSEGIQLPDYVYALLEQADQSAAEWVVMFEAAVQEELDKHIKSPIQVAQFQKMTREVFPTTGKSVYARLIEFKQPDRVLSVVAWYSGERGRGWWYTNPDTNKREQLKDIDVFFWLREI